LKQKPVLVHAGAQASGPNPVHLANYNNTKEMFTTSVFCSQLLWQRSQLTQKDMQSAEIYDAFTPLVITGLEDYGFCKRGEGGPFVASGALRWEGGSLPTNTHGGSLSEAYIHGLNHVVEGVRVLRGDSTSPVPGAEVCLVTSAACVPSSALLLGRR
jgi:acetyl-CoA acetyltransferase